MKEIQTKNKILRIYRSAYKSLKKITPLRFDCGQLCNNKCCKEGSEGMYLFPYESEFLNNKTDKKIIKTDCNMDLFLCDGECDRDFRPLSCRIFPLFPYLDDKGNLEIKFDIRAKSICPLQFTDIPEIQIQKRFIKRIKKVFYRLVKYRVFNDYCRKLSDEIIFLEKFHYKKDAFPLCILWLPKKDSNPHKLIQSQLCYHYTIRQSL